MVTLDASTSNTTTWVGPRGKIHHTHPNSLIFNLIVLTELMLALAALVEHGRPLAHGTKLHGIKIEFWMATLRTRLIDCGVLHPRIINTSVLVHPSRLLLLSRPSHLLLLANQALESRLIGTRATRNGGFTTLRCAQYTATCGTERPRAHSLQTMTPSFAVQDEGPISIFQVPVAS